MSKETNRAQEIAVQAAVALAQKTQATAEALAAAKVASDIQAAIMATKIDQIVKSVENIEKKLDEKYTTKEEHIVLQRIVDGNSISIKAHEKFQDTLTGKIIGISAAASVVAFIAGLIINHTWK